MYVCVCVLVYLFYICMYVEMREIKSIPRCHCWCYFIGDAHVRAGVNPGFHAHCYCKHRRTKIIIIIIINTM